MLNLRKGGLEPLFMVNGNLSQKISKITGEKTLHSWDEENRKVQTVVKNPDDSIKRTISYKYDGLERRIQKNVNGVATNFVYDSEDIILEFGENNAVKAMYLHGPGVDEPIAMVRDVNGDGNFSSNELFFYLKDHLGSVHVLTDKDGVPVQRYNYSAYGRTKVEKVSASVKLVKSPFGFTSREWEEETGDYYYRARYYDPQTGRFLSEDPKGFKGEDVNLYRYVMNNPLIYTDPNGKFAWGAVFEWAATAIIKQIVGYPIKKTFTDAPIKNEDQDVKDMYEEEKRKRERDREGCGVYKSCEPEPQQCPRPA